MQLLTISSTIILNYDKKNDKDEAAHHQRARIPNYDKKSNKEMQLFTISGVKILKYDKKKNKEMQLRIAWHMKIQLPERRKDNVIN